MAQTIGDIRNRLQQLLNNSPATPVNNTLDIPSQCDPCGGMRLDTPENTCRPIARPNPLSEDPSSQPMEPLHTSHVFNPLDIFRSLISGQPMYGSKSRVPQWNKLNCQHGNPTPRELARRPNFKIPQWRRQGGRPDSIPTHDPVPCECRVIHSRPIDLNLGHQLLNTQGYMSTGLDMPHHSLDIPNNPPFNSRTLSIPRHLRIPTNIEQGGNEGPCGQYSGSAIT